MKFFFSCRLTPEGQGVDKHTHDTFGIGMIAAGHRAAYDHVFLPAVLCQQHLVTGHQHHIKCDIIFLASLFQAGGGGIAQPRTPQRTLKTLQRRSGIIRGQVQYRDFPCEPLQPILLLPGEPRLTRQCPLPYPIIFILNPQRC